MNGVTLLQAVPGSINITLLIGCIIAGILALIAFIGSIIFILNGDDSAVVGLLFLTGMFIALSIVAGLIMTDQRMDNCYYYASIEENITVNEFFQHYDLIKHEDGSALWLIKEKTNNEGEEN